MDGAYNLPLLGCISHKSPGGPVLATIPRGLNAGSAACCRVRAARAEAHGTSPDASYSLLAAHCVAVVSGTALSLRACVGCRVCEAGHMGSAIATLPQTSSGASLASTWIGVGVGLGLGQG